MIEYPPPQPNPETLGTRIRRFREQIGLSASQLAERAGVSKSYISSLENDMDVERRPSAAILYELAKALGVAMSDLLGRPILTQPTNERDESLMEFARQYQIPEADIEMLASIQFRGDRPSTVARWLFIYQAIVGSALIDRDSERGSS